MSKEIRTNKQQEAINHDISKNVVPSITKAFANPIFDCIDRKRLISKITFVDNINDVQPRQEIKNIYPYFDDLVKLGVNPKIIENEFYGSTENTPYARDLLKNPEHLYAQKDLASNYIDPTVSTAALLTSLSILSVPNLKIIENPEMNLRSRELLKRYAIDTTLRNIINNSELNFDDSIFDDIKAKINRDIDDKTTQIYFFGNQILGVLDGQKPDYCAFHTDDELNYSIAYLLATTIFDDILTNMKLNPIRVNLVMKNAKEASAKHIARLTEASGIDMSQSLSLEGDLDNYKLLLNLFAKSQIPLLTMINFNCND